MIVRIVKMVFRAEEIENFLSLFEERKNSSEVLRAVTILSYGKMPKKSMYFLLIAFGIVNRT